MKVENYSKTSRRKRDFRTEGLTRSFFFVQSVLAICLNFLNKIEYSDYSGRIPLLPILHPLKALFFCSKMKFFLFKNFKKNFSRRRKMKKASFSAQKKWFNKHCSSGCVVKLNPNKKAQILTKM